MIRTVDVQFVRIRNGAAAGMVYALDGSAPTLRMSDSAEIKTSLQLEAVYDPAADWLSDRIRPELVIDGVTHPLGVFLPATVEYSEENGQKSVRIEAYDQCWIARDFAGTYITRLLANQTYLHAVGILLNDLGITSVLETPSTATLTQTRTDWDRGTSYLKIINQLLDELNYKPLWFNYQGVAILEPVSVPTAANIQHTLDSTEIRSLLMPQITRKTDVFSAPNAWVCVCANPDKSADLVASSENRNPQSPLSIQRRGRRIYKFVKLNNTPGQAELQAYADKLRDQSLFTGETITVQTGLLPGFGVSDVTALHYGDLDAICIEHAWSMELKTGGTMTHELERVVVNLG